MMAGTAGSSRSTIEINRPSGRWAPANIRSTRAVTEASLVMTGCPPSGARAGCDGDATRQTHRTVLGHAQPVDTPRQGHRVREVDCAPGRRRRIAGRGPERYAHDRIMAGESSVAQLAR